jgi:hypothetical protein
LAIVDAVTKGIKDVIGAVMDSILDTLEQLFLFFKNTLGKVLDAIGTGITILIAGFFLLAANIVGMLTFITSGGLIPGKQAYASTKAEIARGGLVNAIGTLSPDTAGTMIVLDSSAATSAATNLKLGTATEQQLWDQGRIKEGSTNESSAANKKAKDIQDAADSLHRGALKGTLSEHKTDGTFVNNYFGAFSANAQATPGR